MVIILPKWTLFGKRNLPPHRHKRIVKATHTQAGVGCPATAKDG